jgi:hypothetical protein
MKWGSLAMSAWANTTFLADLIALDAQMFLWMDLISGQSYAVESCTHRFIGWSSPLSLCQSNKNT